VKTLLLHTCCGPCAAHAVRALGETYAVTLFFSNGNIAPREEYARRLEAARELAARCEVALVEDVYDHDAWRRDVAGLEHEPERGARCLKCFAFSLGRTARYRAEHGFDLFTTTLTISPHKRSVDLFRIGRGLGPFLEVDLKKRDGFRRSVDLSREWGLYRQAYCGCEFSRHDDA
jgi:predicted adenine nucleotide alpha hydrolase (AANH) superfamily ATPase